MTFPFANAALNMTLKTGWLSLLLCGIFYGAFAQVPPDEHPHHHAAPESSVAKKAPEKITIPDAMLVDQNGKQVHFYNDLVKDKVVAVNFIFTTCTTICPPLGATFAKVQNLLGARQNVQLISISVDPTTDTPERLQEWRAKFSAQPGWTLLTGSKPEVDKLLRALGGFTARKEDHTPTLLIGNGSTGLWTRTYGLAKPTEIVKIIDEMSQNQLQQPAISAPVNPHQKYFTDVALINQNGETMRFYSDLLKGKVVLVNSFFTTCTSVCPPMNQRLAKVQEALGDRLGRDVFIISISVDPTTDTPAKLREYAARFGAKPGWFFVTGEKENVELALYKIGQYVPAKDAHTTIMILGNEPQGTWKKIMGMGKAELILKEVETALAEK